MVVLEGNEQGGGHPEGLVDHLDQDRSQHVEHSHQGRVALLAVLVLHLGAVDNETLEILEPHHQPKRQQDDQPSNQIDKQQPTYRLHLLAIGPDDVSWLWSTHYVRNTAFED